MSDSQVVVAAVSIGIFVATVSALLWYGPQAAMVVLLVAVIGLTIDRISVFKRLDEVWEDTDKALRAANAAIEGLHDLREWLETSDDLAREADTDDLAWEPATQPIELPQQDGPPTEPVTEVAARQVRALMDNAAAEDEWRTRFTFATEGRR